MSAPHEGPRVSRWVIAAEIASLALAVSYLWVLLYPDQTARGLRGWSLASQACYGAASVLGRAGIACEQRYAQLREGII